MKIIDLTVDDSAKVHQAAVLLHQSFASWPSLEQAIRDVEQSLDENCISCVIVNDQDEVIGWIGGNRQYNGNVWELHPLVIHQDYRRTGLGRALVQDFEQQVKLRGGRTIILGTDDDHNETNLSGHDLYGDLTGFIDRFESWGHPSAFYQKLGFIIAGLIPDANGYGKPDILMAKRVP